MKTTDKMILLKGNSATNKRKFSYRGHYIHSAVRSGDARNLTHPGYLWHVEWAEGHVYYPIGGSRAAAKKAIDNKVEGKYDYLPA